MTTYRIGFANLDESNEFAEVVRYGLETAAAPYDDIEIIVRDNQQNDDLALQNAREFADLHVDLVIMYHINEQLGGALRSILFPIPLITVDIPIHFTTYLGGDHRRAAQLAGGVLCHWVSRRWNARLDGVLALVDSRVPDEVNARVDYAIRDLQSMIALPESAITYLDVNHSGQRMARHWFEQWDSSANLAAIGFDAPSTHLLADIVTNTGQTDQVAVIGHAADLRMKSLMQNPDYPLLAATCYNVEQYGQHLMNLVMRHRAGERLPAKNFIDVRLHTGNLYHRTYSG